jgi:hypothetical protein
MPGPLDVLWVATGSAMPGHLNYAKRLLRYTAALGWTDETRFSDFLDVLELRETTGATRTRPHVPYDASRYQR